MGDHVATPITGQNTPLAELLAEVRSRLGTASPAERGATTMRIGPWRVEAFGAPLRAEDFEVVHRNHADIMVEWVEPGETTLPDLEDLASTSLLIVIIRTVTAFRLPIAQLIAPILKARWHCHDFDTDAFVTVLGEAISNAVIHGNLGVPGLTVSSRSGFDAFMKMVDERIAIPAFSNRPLVIGAIVEGRDLHILVRDHGDGYAVTEGLPEASSGDERRLSGRGLLLMRKLCSAVSFDRGGRQVSMRFSSQPFGGSQSTE